MASKTINVAVVGAEFGAEFAPIYRAHPNVGTVGIADLNVELARRVSDEFHLDRVYGDLEEVLSDDTVDAVHLVTGIPGHADQTVATLLAGKHTACTVPMATTFADLQRIIDVQDQTGLTYMMMETAVYTREFFMAKRLMEADEFGTVSYARGTHYQDMTSWPQYWLGLPPMHYGTHAVAPILSLLGTRPSRVRALGAGALTDENTGEYSNRFPVETALVEVEGSDAVVEIARSLYQVARTYTESFSVYGSRASFEWAQLEHEENPVVFRMSGTSSERGRQVSAERVAPRDRDDLLPPSIARFTRQFVYGDDASVHRSFIQGGGHGGSHPHLVHEFVMSVVEGREPAIDAITAASWTSVGIAAHESALNGGRPVEIPRFAATVGALPTSTSTVQS